MKYLRSEIAVTREDRNDWIIEVKTESIQELIGKKEYWDNETVNKAQNQLQTILEGRKEQERTIATTKKQTNKQKRIKGDTCSGKIRNNIGFKVVRNGKEERNGIGLY